MSVPPLADPAAPDEPLGSNRDFLTVLIGQGISELGGAITITALPLLVLALTGSGLAMGIVGVLETIPDLVIGLPSGALADRWDRRRMMLLTDLGRAALTALIPLSVWLDGPTMAVIVLVTLPMNALRVLWQAAYTAAVPALVGRRQVARASAVFEAVYNVGWIAGPAIAGILAAAIGPGPTIALDAATFVVSAGSLLLVRRSLRPEARPEPPHILADIREGVVFLARHPTLRAVVALWTTTSVIAGGMTTALIFLITVDRGLSAEVVGGALSAAAAGSLLGSLLAARSPVRGVGTTMLAGSAGCGVLLILVGREVPVPALLALVFVEGAVNAMIVVAYLAIRTQLSPDALLGRIGATARTLSVGLTTVGTLAAGWLLDEVGGSVTLALMGGALVVAAGIFALRPEIRTARLPGQGAGPAWDAS